MVLAAAVFLPISVLPGNFEGLSKPLLALEWASTVLAVTVLLPASGSYWPGKGSEVAVPLVLLVLAGLTANESRGANVAGMLGWIVGLMSAAVWVLGMKGVRAQWLQPERMPWREELILPLMLPALMKIWKKERTARAALGIGVMAAVLGILVQGNLSIAVAQQEAAPFYLMARSLRLGSLSRMEPLVSMLLTFSWFSLGLYLVMAGKAFLVRAGIKEHYALWMTVAAAGGLIVINMQDTMRIAAKAAVVLWIVAPMLRLKNKSKKDEK